MHKVISLNILLILMLLKPDIALSKDISLFEESIIKFQSQHLVNAYCLIAKEDNILFQQNIYSKADNSLPYIETKMPVASLTKQFIAASILFLKEQGKLNLHKPIITYLKKDHPIWQGQPPDWANIITPHHMLIHSSGLPNYIYDLSLNVDNIPSAQVIPTIINKVKTLKLAFEPGSKFDYNNTGYLLLSTMIEHLSEEKDISKFFSNHIFKKAKMNDSYFPSVEQEKSNLHEINKTNQFPIRYTANLDDIKAPVVVVKESDVNKSYLNAPLVGSGALISTATDLLKWNNALYSGKIISPQSLKLMITPYVSVENAVVGKVEYGYGIIIDRVGSDLLYRHGGWLVGMRSDMSYNPRTKTSVILLSNLSPDGALSDFTQYRQVKTFSDFATQLQRIANRY
jgi:CubicO group peptidase (beta-lactamase class C family)